MKNFFFLTLVMMPVFLLGACSPKKHSHNQGHQHTSKLKKSLSIHFNSIDKISISSSQKFSNLKIQIFLLDHNRNKTLLEERERFSHEELHFNLPEEIENYTYVIAVVEGQDSYGNFVSDVSNYKIGEQEQINAAKEKLKNR